MTGQPDPSYVSAAATAPRVAGRDAGDAPGLEPPAVHVELAGEQHSLPSHVDHLVRSRGRVPELTRHLAVRGVQEPVALVFVLADEHDERPIAVREARVLPPPAQEGVVAPELLVVLVHAPRPVELNEDHATAVAVGSRHLEDRVGAHEAGARIAEEFSGPVIADAQHSPPGTCLAWRLDVRLSLPREEEISSGAAVGEHPGVQLQVVQYEAVVVDLPARNRSRGGTMPTRCGSR